MIENHLMGMDEPVALCVVNFKSGNYTEVIPSTDFNVRVEEPQVKCFLVAIVFKVSLKSLHAKNIIIIQHNAH